MLPSPRAWLEFEAVGVESVSDGFLHSFIGTTCLWPCRTQDGARERQLICPERCCHDMQKINIAKNNTKKTVLKTIQYFYVTEKFLTNSLKTVMLYFKYVGV